MDSYPSYSMRISRNWGTLIGAILISCGWFFLWFWQWQTSLPTFYWLQLGIGLILFIIPGFCVYALCSDPSHITFNHFTFGFAISHLMFAVLGALGRLVHVSFDTIKTLMALAGWILLLLYVLPQIRDIHKIAIRSIKTVNVLPVTLLIFVAVLASLINIQRVLNDDDLTYLAYLTNWQNSTHLDFNDIIFGEPALVHPRLWLMSVPFAQALLADLARLPGILLVGGYYEPFLVLLAVLCWYELARTLKLSPRAAGASSILQLAFLLLLSEYFHPGAPFFNQLNADKATAAFIIAPVFFQSLIRLLENATKRNLFLFFIVGLSLTFMHPIVMAYSVFIGGAFTLFSWKKHDTTQRVIVILVFLAMLIPHVVLRFIKSPTQANIPYSSQDAQNQRGLEDMIQRWGDTQFYGFNPAILDMKIPVGENIPIPEPIMERGWLILPILSAFFALREVRRNVLAQFLLACFLLCLLAWFPFTGWIIGYFLSAWMLERAVWLFPFGLSAAYIILIIRERFKIKTSLAMHNLFSPNRLLLIAAVSVAGLFFLFMHENSLLNFDTFRDKSERLQALADAGRELDRKISGQAYVLGTPNLNDFIPGVSAKSKLIAFHISDPSYMPYYSDEQREERISDMQKVFSKAFPLEDKMSLLEKYNVHFILMPAFDLRLFKDLIAAYPARMEVIEMGGFVILQIND